MRKNLPLACSFRDLKGHSLNNLGSKAREGGFTRSQDLSQELKEVRMGLWEIRIVGNEIAN